MTKRKALVLLLLLACIAIAGLVVTTRKHSEPTYNGKPLSEWCDESIADIETTQQVHAIRQIGTNALPFLLKWLQSQPTPFEEKVSAWLAPLHIDPSYQKSKRLDEAVLGFWALGEDAKPAIPALISLVDSTNNLDRLWALEALGAIGNAALPALLDVVTNSLAHTNCDRLDMIAAVRGLKTNAVLAQSALLAHIRDPDPQVASAALYVLGTLVLEDDTMAIPADSRTNIVPALCANLDTTNKLILAHIIRALAQYHTDGDQTVPLLLQKLTSTNQEIRAAATAALNQIDPQALHRAQKQ